MRLNLLETAATSAFKRLFMLVVVVIVIWLLGSHLLDLSRWSLLARNARWRTCYNSLSSLLLTTVAAKKVLFDGHKEVFRNENLAFWGAAIAVVFCCRPFIKLSDVMILLKAHLVSQYLHETLNICKLGNLIPQILLKSDHALCFLLSGALTCRGHILRRTVRCEGAIVWFAGLEGSCVHLALNFQRRPAIGWILFVLRWASGGWVEHWLDYLTVFLSLFEIG